jgi:hypothetical protein
VLAATFGLVTAQPASAESISETMTDRCSNDVYISQYYNDQFPPSSGIFLKRNGDAYTDWSDWMPVAGRTYIRWWCHSTTGNWADPGTWRIDGGSVVVGCSGSDCTIVGGGVNIYTFDVNGWTAERSRCDSSNTQ